MQKMGHKVISIRVEGMRLMPIRGDTLQVKVALGYVCKSCPRRYPCRQRWWMSWCERAGILILLVTLRWYCLNYQRGVKMRMRVLDKTCVICSQWWSWKWGLMFICLILRIVYKKWQKIGRFTKKDAACVKDFKKWPQNIVISSMYKNFGVPNNA